MLFLMNRTEPSRKHMLTPPGWFELAATMQRYSFGGRPAPPSVGNWQDRWFGAMMWLYGPPPPHQPSIQLYPLRSQFGVSAGVHMAFKFARVCCIDPTNAGWVLIGLSVMFCIR